MKKIRTLILSVVLMVCCCACEKPAEEQPLDIAPQITQMRTICELAVMECYYHNVAKYFEEEAEKGFLGIGKKDKRFWIEYSGTVKLGIDASKLKVEVADTRITVAIPKAKVLSCDLDDTSLTKDSFIVDKDSADVTAEDQTKTMKEAQEALLAAASANEELLANAQQRAQGLIEDYIKNIGSIAGKEYSVQWVYEE